MLEFFRELRDDEARVVAEQAAVDVREGFEDVIQIRVAFGYRRVEYRKKVYTYEEILDVIARYGLPQDWNDDGSNGPERYIEAHVWCDDPVRQYIKQTEHR